MLCRNHSITLPIVQLLRQAGTTRNNTGRFAVRSSFGYAESTGHKYSLKRPGLIGARSARRFAPARPGVLKIPHCPAANAGTWGNTREHAMPIKYRLLLLLAIPSLWIVLLAGWFVQSRYAAYDETRTLRALTQIAASASELIHTLQKERGRSSGYFNSQGRQFAAELRQQRQETDAKLAAYQAIRYDDPRHERFLAARRRIQAELQRLDDTRVQVDSLQGDSATLIAYYTGTIAALIDSIRRSGELVTDNPELQQMLNSYISLVELKERTGIMRAVYSGVFGRNAFTEPLFRRAMELEAETRIFAHLFRFSAKPEYQAAYDKLLEQPEVREARQIKRTAQENHRAEALGINPENWFRLISEQINLQKQLEDRLAQDILSYTDTAMRQQQQSLVWLAAGFLGMAALSLWIFLRTYRSIVFPMRTAARLLTQMARGDLNF